MQCCFLSMTCRFLYFNFVEYLALLQQRQPCVKTIFYMDSRTSFYNQESNNWLYYVYVYMILDNNVHSFFDVNKFSILSDTIIQLLCKLHRLQKQQRSHYIPKFFIIILLMFYANEISGVNLSLRGDCNFKHFNPWPYSV